MKIIYSGGWNNRLEESIRASFLYSYHETIKKAISQGKKIALVTLAKEDGYYDHLINPIYAGVVDIIDTQTKKIKWDSYDGIFLLGGKASMLKTGLLNAKFSLSALKPDAVILGDSAGSHVLSSYFYISPVGPLRGVEIEFAEGFDPKVNLIQIAHKNNPLFCNDLLISKVTIFAKEKGLRVLILDENEQKTEVEGKFIDVDKANLF